MKTRQKECLTPLCAILLVVFIVLKVCGVIGWSWWLVLMPLWAYIAIIIAAAVVVYNASKRRVKRFEENKHGK